MDSATLAVRRSFPAAAPAAASDDDAAPLTSAGGRPQREQLTSFGHFRAIVAQVMRLHAVEWTIVGLSVADFVFVLLQIGWTLMRDPQCACDEDCTEEEPLWFKLCGYASLAITSLFLVEIPLDLIGFGFDFYLTQRFHWLHVLDASVVVVAFCLEVAVDSISLCL
ncbi:uncharacterized protein JCM10292_002887 [Rhodotorula paludigena]|uniref:uncharacterized protein n=1 Tax=Rhodotorula paludigena TaxID=86838 RepID=UPI003179AD14